MHHLAPSLRIVLSAVLLTVLPVLAGCGGGSDSASTQAALPSPAGTPDSGAQANRAGKEQMPDAKQKNTPKPNHGSSTKGAEKNSSGSRHRSALVKKVEELVGGSHKGRRVVSSRKEIRKIIDELRKPSHQKGKPHSPTAVVEELLGRR